MTPSTKRNVLVLSVDTALYAQVRQALFDDQVQVADSGPAGVHLAEQRPPDVVLIDNWLRGQPGLDALKQFRAAPALRSLPVIAIGDLPELGYATAQQATANGYLTKPFTADTLHEACQAVLSGREYYPELPHVDPCRIVVIDDEPELGGFARYVLERARGDEVRYFESGSTALDAIEADPPDLVILDLMMPDMDGAEVFRQLQARSVLSAIPVIFQTAKFDFPPEAQRLGAYACLIEPYGPRELLNARDAAQRGEKYFSNLANAA